MNDIAYDINVLENALIALQEGAGDEKRAALYMLQRLLDQKQNLLNEFEKFFQLEDGVDEGQVV